MLFTLEIEMCSYKPPDTTLFVKSVEMKFIKTQQYLLNLCVSSVYISNRAPCWALSTIVAASI